MTTWYIPFWHITGTVSTQIDGQDVCTKTEILDLLLELLYLQWARAWERKREGKMSMCYGM
jgi:hypothetical protein